MMMSRSMLTALLPHGVHIVHLWMIYGLEGRMHSRSIVIAQTTCNSINRVAIQWGLLVEFSCDPHLISYWEICCLVWLLVFVTSGCHNMKCELCLIVWSDCYCLCFSSICFFWLSILIVFSWYNYLTYSGSNPILPLRILFNSISYLNKYLTGVFSPNTLQHSR